MELQEQQAKAIVHEINQVLPQKINLMNQKGIIIASTDPGRIHTFHGGAAKIINQGLDELRIYSNDEYPGARPGTNFILQVADEPIGVLGITGPYETIRPLANVIRKMTELLVQAQEVERIQSSFKYQQSLFLTEAISYGESFLTKQQLERGQSLGINLQLPRRILVAEIVPNQPDYQPNLHELAQRLAECAHGIDPFCCHTVTNQLMVFLTCLKNNDSLLRLAQKLRECVKNPHWDIYIGIDAPAEDNTKLREAFQQAQKALHSCHRKGNIRIKSYADINMELFADLIPLTAKKEYVHKIFSNYTNEELAEAMHTLECYFEHDGSIADTAHSLFIHKNTLQQHLKKIARRTGYDPRSLRCSGVFYMVLYFYQDITLEELPHT